MSRRKLRIVDVLVALTVIGIALFVVLGPVSDNPPPTHAQYAAKANKVCSDIEEEQAHLDNTIFKGIPFDRSPPPALYAKYVRAIIPTFERQLATLRKITPPKGDEAKLERYFRATQDALAVLREVAADPRKVHVLVETDVFLAADKAARNYGLLACGHAED
ncbi:MAG: hypothetical protein QOJ38_533 [Solirubrobacterales bacterium]|nr:hypothetical protein [Solirubrobacterales bacterium]